MDLNVKLIEAVKKCPLLYKTNASLAERQSGWKLISEQMKMQERFLQSRWHLLLKRYQQEYQNESRDIGQDFIYKKEMEFLLPHIRQSSCSTSKEHTEEVLDSEEILPDNVIKPEFIITEEDFDNDSGNEEFVYLEVETLEGSGPEEEQKRKQHGKEQQSKPEQQISSKQMVADIKKENISADPQPSQSAKLQTQNRGKTPEIIVENPENVINIKTECSQFEAKRENAKEHIEENVNVNTAPSQSQPQNTSKAVETNTTNAASSNERCEDDIFGELVTAMLKRMPVEKKRGVKKEIMNMLLT